MKTKTLLLGLSMLALPFMASAASHPAGTNVISNGTVSMVTAEGQLRPYTSAGAFLSYGFNSFSTVVQATSDDLALPTGNFIPPRDGGITCSDRGGDKGTCYLITNSQKAAFTSSDVFSKLGFDFKRAVTGDVSFLPSTSNINTATDAHLPGTLVNDNGTVKLIGSSGAVGVPSVDTLKSWGYSLSDVVPANTADKTITQTDVLPPHTVGELAPKFVPCMGAASCEHPKPISPTPAPFPCATTNSTMTNCPPPSPAPAPTPAPFPCADKTTATVTCPPPSPAPTPTPSPSSVTITSLTPTSGPVGTVVTVTGTGLTSKDNYLLFGLGASSGYPSTDGKTFQFTVPTSQKAYCSVGMACPMIMQLVTSGAYNVRVANANGMSDSLVFTVTGTGITPIPCTNATSCGTTTDTVPSTNILVGTVTNNATITMTKADAAFTTLSAGTYKIYVQDQSAMHNFHLSGPGINQLTTVDGITNTSWTVTLTAGTYTYQCDPHSGSMHGSFIVN